MLKVTIDSNNKELIKYFDKLPGKLARTPASTLSKIAAYVVEVIKTNIAVGGRDESGASGTWAPLKKSTKVRNQRAKGKLSKGPRMEDTIEKKEVGKNYVDVGTNHEGAYWQEQKTLDKPARPIMVIPENDAEKIADIYAKGIDEILEAD